MSDLNSTSKRLRLLVLYEYGKDYRPFSSSFLRLIRPLTHPAVQPHIDATFDLDYHNQPADYVIIDRLWRPDVTLPMVQELVNKIRLKGIRIAYSLDDNYFDLAFSSPAPAATEILPIVTFLLRQADAVLVATPNLRQKVLEYNQNVHILPNQLDERLLVYRPPVDARLQIDHKPLTIGYMGTFTHDDDLRMVLSTLRAIHQRHPGQIEFQVVGVVQNEGTRGELQDLPVRYVYPNPEEHEYPLFMPWFTGHIHWDIAISPLKPTPFNDCKSDIKFLDYASIGAAGIFSQSPAYAATVQHQQNGLLVENTPEAWEDALENLLGQPDLRFEIARNASRYLYSDRLLAVRAPDWVALLQALS
jgi:processive 1,2-diacylglycerol beta-glucosyltransferase